MPPFRFVGPLHFRDTAVEPFPKTADFGCLHVFRIKNAAVPLAPAASLYDRNRSAINQDRNLQTVRKIPVNQTILILNDALVTPVYRLDKM
jgi:hypothetical protein